MSRSFHRRSFPPRISFGSLKPSLLIGVVCLVSLGVIVCLGCYCSSLGNFNFSVASAEAENAQENADELPIDGDSSFGGESSQPKTIFVHVAGAVNTPGLYELAEGSRVADAVEAAGGLGGDAVSESVNLARVLKDGEQLIIRSTNDQNSTAATGASGTSSTGSSRVALVNINSATAQELETVNGIGPATAEKIIKDRSAHGPFESVDDLTRISGIGEKKLEALRDQLCV